jgi:glycosyltransferase involved in cell wall biosynthesis
LALPNAMTTEAFCLDGFSQLTMRMAKLLKGMGHYVMLYGGDQNEAPCDEHISTISTEEHANINGGQPWPYQNAIMQGDNPLWKLAQPRVIDAIGQRKQAHDMIFTLGGVSQKPIYDAHPELMDVEYSIGYPGNCCRYRVFESHAWKHICYAAQSIGSVRFYDAVIPCFYEAETFPFYGVPDPYFVYVGRLIPKKGIKIACEAAKVAGVPLKVIGHGDKNLVTYGEFLGPLSTKERNEVVAHASGVFCPTIYLEPFNQVAAEAQMSGVPVICTDQGGFTETVQQGVSGYRCNLFREFVRATERCAHGELDRGQIRNRAVRLYGMDAAQRSYTEYIDRLSTLHGRGWYE